MRGNEVQTGYEGVPTTKRDSALVTAGIVMGSIVFMLVCWTLFGLGMTTHGPDRGGYSDTATVKSCDRVGPISIIGVGFYWSCTADVRLDSSVSVVKKVITVKFRPRELSPDDIGKPVPVHKVGKFYQRDTKREAHWWSLAPGVAGFVALAVILHRNQRKAFRARPPGQVSASDFGLTPVSPGTGLVDVLAPGETWSTTVHPRDWSKKKFWRICGVILAVAAVSAVVGFSTTLGDLREVSLTIAAMGFLSPGWLWFLTPRFAGKRSSRTLLKLSDGGVQWYRRDKATFALDWNEVQELRVTGITDGTRTLWTVDVIPAEEGFPQRHPELGGLWRIAGFLNGRPVPPVESGYRLPEAFTEAAVGRVRSAMLAAHPDRYTEFTGRMPTSSPAPDPAPPRPAHREPLYGPNDTVGNTDFLR